MIARGGPAGPKTGGSIRSRPFAERLLVAEDDAPQIIRRDSEGTSHIRVDQVLKRLKCDEPREAVRAHQEAHDYHEAEQRARDVFHAESLA